MQTVSYSGQLEPGTFSSAIQRSCNVAGERSFPHEDSGFEGFEDDML